MIYIGLAISDSMFPESCELERIQYDAEDVKSVLASVLTVQSCCNPSHQSTLNALKTKFGLDIPVPEKPPSITLKSGDSFIICGISGLPRCNPPREYTPEEVDKATFRFGAWIILE